MSDVFGDIFVASALDDAIEACLREWIDSYMAKIAAQWNGPELPGFRSYNVRPSGESFPEDQYPGCIIVNAGLDDSPYKGGDGVYTGTFRVGVICTALGATEDGARRNAEWYAAAVRAILLQQRGLGGFVSNVELVAESYNEGPSDGVKTMAASINEFLFTVDGVVNSRMRPMTPDVKPGDTLSTVEKTFLEVDHDS